jgi:DNA polymerase IIIc chi subunit
VVDWQRFDPAKWDIVYDIEKLVAHGIKHWEAAEAMWNVLAARPNKKAHGPNRYQLIALTDAVRLCERAFLDIVLYVEKGLFVG